MSRITELAATAKDLPEETVDIPEWGCAILVRGMDGTKRSEMLQRLAEGKAEDPSYGFINIEPDILVLCCIDPEDDSQAFIESDIPLLMTKSGAVIGRLSNAAMRVCGFSQEAEKTLGKDSGDSMATVSDGSTSTSPVS